MVADSGGWSGFEVYASVPGSNNGAYSNISAPAPLSALPLGTVTFNISGLPTAGQVICFVYYNNSVDPVISDATPVNGMVTLNALGSGGATGVTQVQVYIATTTTDNQNAAGPPYASVTINNIRYNNQTVLADLTYTEHSTNTPSSSYPLYGYCAPY